MRRNDVMRMALQNLLRKLSRTMLTVLGVVVGCCSIIIMVSIGIGSKVSQEAMLAEMGDLTIIQVHPAGGNSKAENLNAASMKKIAAIQGVIASTPRLSFSAELQIYTGSSRRYASTFVTITGMDTGALEKMGFQLLDGKYPAGKEALVGQDAAYSFADTLRPAGYNTIDIWEYYGKEKPAPYFDPMKEEYELVVRLDDPKKEGPTLKIAASGRLKEDYGKGSETVDGFIIPIGELEQLQMKYNRLSGKAANSTPTYQSALVKVKDIGSVAEVEKQIQALGFRTSSMESIRKPMEKEAQQKQMMLGGLGAVSLIVAAIGITNTMIMSISERTREIGIMKALGCYVSNIRVSFLLEAGCIGFIGGVAGIVISLLASLCINIVSSATPLDSFSALLTLLSEPRMSIIPAWLAGAGLAFSVLIGVGAGYYPANKAVMISALEAMKQ